MQHYPLKDWGLVLKIQIQNVHILNVTIKIVVEHHSSMVLIGPVVQCVQHVHHPLVVMFEIVLALTGDLPVSTHDCQLVHNRVDGYELWRLQWRLLPWRGTLLDSNGGRLDCAYDLLWLLRRRC
jgi:hypothetical protein